MCLSNIWAFTENLGSAHATCVLAMMMQGCLNVNVRYSRSLLINVGRFNSNNIIIIIKVATSLKLNAHFATVPNASRCGGFVLASPQQQHCIVSPPIKNYILWSGNISANKSQCFRLHVFMGMGVCIKAVLLCALCRIEWVRIVWTSTVKHKNRWQTGHSNGRAEASTHLAAKPFMGWGRFTHTPYYCYSHPKL